MNVQRVARECKCGKILHIEFRWNDGGWLSHTTMYLLHNCFFHSSTVRRVDRDRQFITRSDEGLLIWAGPYQDFVYCSGCGGRRWVCTFKEVQV